MSQWCSSLILLLPAIEVVTFTLKAATDQACRTRSLPCQFLCRWSSSSVIINLEHWLDVSALVHFVGWISRLLSFCRIFQCSSFVGRAICFSFLDLHSRKPWAFDLCDGPSEISHKLQKQSSADRFHILPVEICAHRGLVTCRAKVSRYSRPVLKLGP